MKYSDWRNQKRLEKGYGLSCDRMVSLGLGVWVAEVSSPDSWASSCNSSLGVRIFERWKAGLKVLSFRW
jgi:hypothetical protein